MSSSEHKYYQAIRVLGIAEGATPMEVKRAYRNLSKKYHPDVNALDTGERFKEVNAAYAYLKKHPEPPQKNYQQPTQPVYQDYSREERRRRYWAKKQREAEMKQQMFDWIFFRARVILFAVIFLNIVLAVDYVLPKQPVKSELKGRKVVTIRTTRMKETSVILQFEGGYKMRMNSKVTNDFEKGDQFQIFRTYITKQIIKLKPLKEPNTTYYQSYSVFAVFGFIIPLVLVAGFLYFRVVKNNDYKLSILLVMIFCASIQLFLLVTT